MTFPDIRDKEMTLLVREVTAKSLLTPWKIYPWVINPNTGCQHGCSYCYAKFMKRVTGHKEPWGEFVDVKVNAPELLEKEVRKKRRDRVWVSGVCDPYQTLEEHYRLTRQCLEILARHRWPVVIQTRLTPGHQGLGYHPGCTGLRGRVLGRDRG